MIINRRRALSLGLSAAALGSLSARAQDVTAGLLPDYDADDFVYDDDAIDAQLDALVNEPQASAVGNFTFEDFETDKTLRKELRDKRVVPAMKNRQISAARVEDAQSPDLRHVGEGAEASVFPLTSATLEAMAASNAYDATFLGTAPGLRINADKVVFGLRGCRIAQNRSAAGQPSERIDLIEAAIDHQELNCVIGVWDRKAHTVSAFSASTTPNLMNMQIYRIGLFLKGLLQLSDPTVRSEDRANPDVVNRAILDWRTNQLGLGLHVMHCGRHAASPNLLRQDANWYGPVLRAKDGLGYRLTDWDRDFELVNDNIHPAWPSRDGIRHGSAGCNVIHGGGCMTTDEGGVCKIPYRDSIVPFQDQLGLTCGFNKGRRFFYMLLTGREARLHAQGWNIADARRWRFGSSGEDIATIQSKLSTLHDPAGREAGVLGLKTFAAVLRWQENRGLPTDGIIDRDLLSRLGG
ncbi:MAG: peptidoglycan-binding domain-containing protein [Pseudomonadota bacterium]